MIQNGFRFTEITQYEVFAFIAGITLGLMLGMFIVLYLFSKQLEKGTLRLNKDE